jgi:gas vesicle protein
MDNGPTGGGTTQSCGGGLAIGLLTVALVVGVATLLYAPQSGEETRAKLNAEYNETLQMFQRWVNELKERASRILQIMGASAEREVRSVGKDQ